MRRVKYLKAGVLTERNAATPAASDPTWSRFLLNSGSTRADPGGGATVTVNSETSDGWTDLSRAASNDRKISEHSSWSIGLTKVGGGALTWADSFLLETHIVFSQGTAAGDTFAGQMVLPVVANAAAPSTNAHFWFGYGWYSSNGTTVKLGRTYSADSSVNPQFTSQQVKSTGWTNQGRVICTYKNTVQRSGCAATAEFRSYDNSVFQAGVSADIRGFVGGMTHFAAGATDQVYLVLYVPGWNSSGSYDVVNCKFKLFYNIHYLPQDPTG